MYSSNLHTVEPQLLTTSGASTQKPTNVMHVWCAAAIAHTYAAQTAKRNDTKPKDTDLILKIHVHPLVDITPTTICSAVLVAKPPATLRHILYKTEQLTYIATRRAQPGSATCLNIADFI